MHNLLKITGFVSFVGMLFLNSFVDLGHKVIIQNTIFKCYDGSTQIVLTAAINALILLPFIGLFTPAGFVSDKYPKNRVMRVGAWCALALTLGILACYSLGWFWVAFLMTFLLAVQSAFYSPAKYGYIKMLVGKESLAQANAVVQATTIFAILAGIFVFSVLFEAYVADVVVLEKATLLRSMVPVGYILIGSAFVELLLAYRLPAFEETDDGMAFEARQHLNGVAIKDYLKPVFKTEAIWLSIVGVSVFWAIGQVMLAAFPAHAKESLSIGNTVLIQGMLAASGIGVIFGSMVAGQFSKRHIETGLIPVGAAGFSLTVILLPMMDSAGAHFINFLFSGFFGGLMLVPLNAMIQYHAEEHESGRVIAGSNWIQNIAMLTFLGITAVCAMLGLSSVGLFVLMALVAVVGGTYTVLKLPQSMVRFLVTYAMSRRYKISIQGFDNLPEKGGVLLLGNHISWIDWAIVQIACPRAVRFVMLKSIYERWYLKWFFDLFGAIPIARGESSQSLEMVADLLNDGQVVCIFPEGLISRTGHLSQFKSGFERACEAATDDVVIIPFYMRGLWGSQFSRASDKLKDNKDSRVKRDIIVAFGKSMPKDSHADIVKRRVFDLSIRSWDEYTDSLATLPISWIATAKRLGRKMAVADPTSGALSATVTLAMSTAMAARIRRLSPEQNIGILLPASAGAALANMAVLLKGKTVVNLNYTASSDVLRQCITQAEIRSVYTSHAFVEGLVKRGIDLTAAFEGLQVIYLEDLRAKISKQELLLRLLSVKVLPAWLLKGIYCKRVSVDSTAAIVFSSGSEGRPKGIMLSHRNIMANLKQICDVLNTEVDDVMMASLPPFHAFGLTVTQFMPLIEGLPMICHPDPTDSLAIAKSIAKYRATLFCGTSTFLRYFSRNSKVNPLMLESLRIVVAGAEKCSIDVRNAFQTKFNKTIYEGYGATETTPVASVNLPDQLDMSDWHVQTGAKIGTVGMPLPGSSFKIVDPQTLDELASGEEGLILIGGVQVMNGYLNNAEATDAAIELVDGVRWYKTGDKGKLDADGFLTIVDRYSRFAKLAGEMISLSAVEDLVRLAFEDGESEEEFDVVALNIPDVKKGEKIALLVTEDIDIEEIKRRMMAKDCHALMLPSLVFRVNEIPKLGSGKTDFGSARSLLEQQLDDVA